MGVCSEMEMGVCSEMEMGVCSERRWRWECVVRGDGDGSV